PYSGLAHERCVSSQCISPERIRVEKGTPRSLVLTALVNSISFRPSAGTAKSLDLPLLSVYSKKCFTPMNHRPIQDSLSSPFSLVKNDSPQTSLLLEEPFGTAQRITLS